MLVCSRSVIRALPLELVRFARRRRLTDHRVFPIFSEVFPIFSKVFAVLLGFRALTIVGRWRGSVTDVTHVTHVSKSINK